MTLTLFRTLILSPSAICLFSFAHTPLVSFFFFIATLTGVKSEKTPVVKSDLNLQFGLL